MRQILIIISLFTFSINYSFAQTKKGTVSHSQNKNSSTWNLSNNSEEVKLVIKGDVQLADDDQNIKAISPHGSVFYSKKKQNFKVESDAKGNLTYQSNGETISGNASEHPIIEDCVNRLIEYGVDAERRARRIYSTSGFAELMQQVGRLKSDNAKQIYMSFTQKNEKLSYAEMAELLDEVNQQIQNSYYRSMVLSGIKSAYFTDEKIVNKYIQAMKGIGSDYYIYTSLQKILKQPLNNNQFDKILSIATNINSVYYQAEVLKSALNNKSISPQNLATVIRSVADIESDYYKSEVLKESIKSITKNEDIWRLLLNQTSKISSDYYLSETLVLFAKKIPKDANLKEELELTAGNIKTDLYYGKVMRALGNN